MTRPPPTWRVPLSAGSRDAATTRPSAAPGPADTVFIGTRVAPVMPAGLEANVAILAGLTSAGVGLVLAAVGALSARRIGTAKLGWVAAGFLALALQGAWFAYRVWQEPLVATHTALIPAVLGGLTVAVLYVAIYRRP